MYPATFLIAVHPSSVTSSISHRSKVTSTWREVRTRASRRPSSSSVNRPQATTYGRDSGFPSLSMTAMTAILASGSRLHSRTIWGATPPKVYSPESLQNAGFYAGSPCAAGHSREPGEEGPVPRVQFRVHDETVAIAHGIAATPIAVVRMDELRVSTGRTEHSG